MTKDTALKQWRVYQIILCLISPLFFLLIIEQGLLDSFFFGAKYASVKGIDFFSLPKSYLNLLEGKSMYASWDPPIFAERSTWYISHPGFAFFTGPLFAFLSPSNSYAAFVIFSSLLLCFAGFLWATQAKTIKNKLLLFALTVFSFPSFWLLYVGNIHAVLILALSLVFLGLLVLIKNEKMKAWGLGYKGLLFAGLILSLLSKPLVILFVPPLVILKNTRAVTASVLLVYLIISFIFYIVPAFNPEAMPLSRLAAELLTDDQFATKLNVYANEFRLNEYMRCNSIHWLNMLAQSSDKLYHIDIFSWPVFVDTLFGINTPSLVNKLPIFLCWALSLGLLKVAAESLRLEIGFLLVLALSLSFFLSYNTVWEYQYASVMPAVVAILAYLGFLRSSCKKAKDNKPLEMPASLAKVLLTACLVLAIFIYLPSLFFILDPNYEGKLGFSLIRTTRVLPVLSMYLVLILLVLLKFYFYFASKKNGSA